MADPGAIAIADAPSRSPGRVARAAERIDPHWDGVWSRGATAAWMTVREARAQEEALGRRRSVVPAKVDLSGDAARRRLARGANWQLMLSVLGCLDTYRTLSAQQLGYLVGDERIADGRSTLMWDLFTLGVVDFGLTTSGIDGRELRGARLYRPSQSRAFDELIEPLLTYQEWASVTGGRPWESTGQNDRHNIITNELLLRVAEFLPVAAVTGEKLSDLETVAFTSLGRQAPPTRIQRAADGMVVRPDGVRIAVETTASTGASFAGKCERWARLLHDARYADTGLMVVFVVAPRAGRSNSGQHTTVEQVQRTVTRAANLAPGIRGDRTIARMAVASWESWFPERAHLSRSFFTLTARTATGPDPSHPWEEIPLLHPGKLPPADNPRLAQSVPVLAGLRSQPPTLAAAQEPPQLWRRAAASSGIGGLAPKAETTRTGAPMASPSRSQGAAGPIRLPPRVLPHRPTL
ncbi:MAG: hypothetical protein ACTH0V_00565 [Microbacteriaceae bacterium]